MKKTTLFSLLTMLFLFVGSNVWADDEPFYTLLTVPSTGSNHTSYNDYYDDEHDGMIWNAPGNQSLPDKWRIGGKSLDKVDRTITAKTPMGSAIDRVVVNHLGVSKDAITVHSMTLTVASDVEYKTVIDEVELTPTIETGVAGSVEFESSTGTEWPTDAYYKLTINISNSTSSNGGIDLTSIQFFAPDGGGTFTVAKPVITPNGGTFTEPQEVTITAGEDCFIIYTLDGTDPTEGGTEYTEPFIVSETTTVKAVARDVTGAPSSVATAVFTFPTTITSIAELCAAPQGSVTVQFINWTVTGVKGKNAYFTDGSNGILLYENDHGFEVGDQLRGTATFNLTSYKNAPEITGLKTSTEGVIVAAKNVEVTPMEITIGQLQKDMQGCVIKLTDLTYTDGVFNDATGASITPYNTFGITMPTLEDGKNYDATGVAVWFDKWEIAPRSEEDFVEAGTVISVAKPVITPNGGTFTEPQEVTITAEEGCTIIYTTDGVDPSVAAGSQYTGPFTVSEDCVVKAVAVDATGASSLVASAEFKFISATAIPSIARLCAAAPAEGEAEVLVEFNNWIVTGVRGGQVYFTDGPNGIVLYQKDHGFNVGDKVTGKAVVTLTTFNECAEILGLTATTEGITVEAEATPETIALNELSSTTLDKQGCLLYLEGVTYDEANNVFVDDDDNTIEPMKNKFVALPTLLDGKTYNVTGVAIWYLTDGVGSWMIAPRTEDEVELITSQETPVSSWSVEEEVVDVNGTVTAVFTTNSNGLVTYESSDSSVAAVDSIGRIRPLRRGITTITAYVAETATFLPDSKSFRLTVTQDGYGEATFVYNDPDIEGQGAPDVGDELTATRNDIVTLYANRAYAKKDDTHIKVYGTNETNGPSYLQLSVVDGYAITEVVLTVTGKGNLGIWRDQFDKPVDIEMPDSTKATWTGLQNNVVLTNWMGKQARIKTINVTYIKLEDTGKTVTIGESGIATFCSEVKAVVSGAEQFAVAGAVTSIGGKDGTVLVVDTLTSSVPSNTGVLLMGAPGEYKVYTHPDIEETSPAFNLLVGVLSDAEAPVGSFVLKEESAVAFFAVVEDTPVAVPAGQAYLDIPGVAGIPAFFFTEKDYEDGINAVAVEVGENGAIYNVAGQRLSKMQKGINIVGGKKILK